jgi:hypothetical protein
VGKGRRLEEEEEEREEAEEEEEEEKQEEKQEEAGMWERNETCGGVKRRLAQRKQVGAARTGPAVRCGSVSYRY